MASFSTAVALLRFRIAPRVLRGWSISVPPGGVASSKPIAERLVQDPSAVFVHGERADTGDMGIKLDAPVGQLADHQVSESTRDPCARAAGVDHAPVPVAGLAHVPTVAPKWNKCDPLSVDSRGTTQQATTGDVMAERADFAAQLARRRADAGLSLAELAAQAHVNRGYLHHVEHGRRWPTETVVRALDTALDADGTLIATWEAADQMPRAGTDDDQPTELLELAARTQASDVSRTTLDLLDTRVDTMARAYTRLPPAELLRDVRAAARQIGRLLDGRSTLGQRRRLLVAGGWTALSQPRCTSTLASVPRPVAREPSPDHWAGKPSTGRSARGALKWIHGPRWSTGTGAGPRPVP